MLKKPLANVTAPLVKKLLIKAHQLFTQLRLRFAPDHQVVYAPQQGSTVRQWVEATNRADNSNSLYHPIHTPELIQRQQPNTLDGTTHSAFEAQLQYQTPETFVITIPQGRVWGIDGTVITPDNTVLWDVSPEPSRLSPQAILQQKRLPAPHPISGAIAVLSSRFSSTSYFHWMLDLLPRFSLLKQSQIDWEAVDYFLVNRCQSRYQRETLAKLGIPSEKILESIQHPHLIADHLIVPSYTALTGNPPAWVCDFLKSSFLADPLDTSLEGGDRLYISRAKANQRRILNETDLTQLLSQYGFKTLFLEELTVQAQAYLFSKAKVILAPHGAGLTNLVFCQPGTQVLEIFSPEYINVCFWALSNQGQLDYYYLLGDRPTPSKSPILQKQSGDLVINLNAVSNLLSQMNITT